MAHPAGRFIECYSVEACYSLQYHLNAPIALRHLPPPSKFQ